MNNAGKRGRRLSLPETENSDTRISILNCARTLFAEKGYDGASVAEIADGACVNKALVFYYFGSKEKILKEVMKMAASEAVDRAVHFGEKDDPFSRDAIRFYYDETLKVMESRREVIRILLMEALKSSGSGELLFGFLKKSMGEIPEKMAEHGFPVQDIDKMRTTEFFFIAMALYTFAALEEKWSEFSRIDREKVRDQFFDVFDKTYLEYIANNYYSKK